MGSDLFPSARETLSSEEGTEGMKGEEGEDEDEGREGEEGEDEDERRKGEEVKSVKSEEGTG